jgi:O-antigen ligase
MSYASSSFTSMRRRAEPAAERDDPELRPALRLGPWSRRWQALLLGLWLALVLLAPLPLGSNRPLPASALAAAVGVLLCLWGVGCLFAPAQASVPPRRFWPALVLIGLAAAWAAVQAMPFTPAVLHHPYWREVDEVLGSRHAGAISVNPAATWIRLMGLLAYVGIFWLASQLCRTRSRAHQVLFALAAGGLLYAAYGLFDLVQSDAGIVTSTFVNRNSYATYAGITLFCGLGLVLRELSRRSGASVQVRGFVVDVLSRLAATLAIGVITCLVAGTALLMTQSRGAFVGLCAALVAFVWSLRRMALITSRGFVKAAALLSVGLVFAMVGLAGEETLGRFADGDVHTLNRLAYYRATWDAIQDRPLLGTGYGTYADAFAAYNHPGTGTYFLDKAHNTYLQLIMELGWPAAAALYAGLALLVFRCLDGESAVYAAVLVSCSVLVAVHSLVDFSLEMPANAATYALLLGGGCAQAVRGRIRRGVTALPLRFRTVYHTSD